MNVEIKSETRRYHVSFEQDNSKVFIKGPHKGGLQTVTTCEIFLMTGANGLGLTRTLISSGVTTLGSRDRPDSYIGCKEAFTRALRTTYFSKAETTVFWKEFHIRHKRIDTVKPAACFVEGEVTAYFPSTDILDEWVKDEMARRDTIKVGKPSCVEKFSNYGGIFSGVNPKSMPTYEGGRSGNRCPHKQGDNNSCRIFSNVWCVTEPCEDEFKKRDTGGSVHGYGGLHSHQQRAMKKMIAMSQPRYGLDTFYGHRRHEYGSIIQSYMDQPARTYSVGGKTVDVRKIAGLGWTRPAPEHKRDKAEQLRQMYGYHLPSTLGAHRQAENRCHRVADAGLTAHMRSMQLLAGEKADKLDAELLSRPGITKVLGEYIIDADVFVSAFKVDDVVTFEDGLVAKVVEVDTIRVMIQPIIRNFGYTMKFGPTQTVMDWEVKKHVGRLRRFWTWLRALAKIHREDSLPEAVVKPNVPYVHSLEHGKISGRELWEVIDRDHCPSCGRIGEFLQGPRGGSCLNIKCILCNQKYWVDPLSRTAKKLDD